MTHKALIRQLQISCLGLDPIDPLRLLVDDVIAALAQHDSVQAKPEPEQEPVAWLSTDSIGERHLCFDKPLDNDPVQPLYTTPPQRTWVGLTDEEYAHITDTVFHTGQGLVAYYKAIEAKLKEKNNAA
jgi:hypothetical protein